MILSKNIKEFRITIVTKYVLKEFLLTFLICFLFFFIMFFINFILVHIKPFLQQNVPFHLVATLMITYFPTIIIFSLPFGTLLATLMVMGRFSSDNEIIAFRAHGINIFKLFTPIFFCGIIITIVTFIVNDRLFPISWHQRNITLRKISKIKPTLNFKSKTIKKHEEKTIFTNVVVESHIKGLIIIDRDEDKNKRIITAKNTEIISSKKKSGLIELKMNNTMLQFENKDRPHEFNFGYAELLSYFIDLQEFYDINPKNIPSVAKYTIENLQDIKKYSEINKKDILTRKKEITSSKGKIKSLEYNSKLYLNDNITFKNYLDNINSIDKNVSSLSDIMKEKIRNSSLNESLIEFYRKFTNPFACIIFAIFAAPIGIFSRKAGYQIGFIIGLFLAAFYWFFLMGTWTMGRKMVLDPFIAMFLPNLFFLVIGLFALFKRLKE